MEMINIIVCIKQVSDPEAPVSTYSVDSDMKHLILKGAPPVMSPFDENALEAALRIKDINQTKITVLTLGRKVSRAILRKSLAAGADELVILEDDMFSDLDSCSTALLLSRAIVKSGKYDLIVTGRQAADTNAGMVGSGIAHILDIPVITEVRNIEILNDRLRAARINPEGYDVVESSLPAVVTVSNEIGALRSIALPDMINARKKPLEVWNAGLLGIVSEQINPRNIMLKLFIPQYNGKCEMIAGSDDREKGKKLARIIGETGIIR
jgi:electron transfer flavoprotein beta subunit